MVSLVGEGPVLDPSLEPDGTGRYPSIAAWLDAAETVGDHWSTAGYGFSEPFELFLERQNPSLEAAGIEDLSITMRFWVNQDCELRVEAAESVVSAPDPCLYDDLYRPEETGIGCDAPFDPRAGHVAVWSGNEVLIYGGASGTTSSPPYTSGLGCDPQTRTWRDLEPSPQIVEWWPTLQAIWTGEQMIVAGRTVDAEDPAMVLLSYSPTADTWSVSSPVPEGRQAIGGVVWTGTEVILAGGDLHYPSNSAWAFNPATETWRRLPDPGFEPVEGIEGVWTGTEAVFVGGYVHPGSSAAAAYNPESDTWRTLAPVGVHWIREHHLTWTGEQVIVYSGHTGSGHLQRLLLYDPGTDEWSESSTMPIAAPERLGGAWTGDRLIIWGEATQHTATMTETETPSTGTAPCTTQVSTPGRCSLMLPS